MKRFFISSIIILALIFLSLGCDNNQNNDTINQSVLTEESTNYKIYSYQYADFLREYFYFISDKNGNRIDSGSYLNYCPNFEELSPRILKMHTSFGTYAGIEKYYDLNNATVSKEYQGVLYDDKEKVAYIEFKNHKTYLKVQKIFSDNIILKEELDLGGAVIAAASPSTFDVSVSGDTITVKHVYGPDYKEITETFSLKKDN